MVMANELGMFGQDPAMLQQAIEQQARQGDLQAAQLQPGRGIIAGGAQVGRQLGNTLSGMLGYQDPRMAETNTIKQIQQESMNEAMALGINPSKDIEKFGELVSNKYMQYNMPDKAYGVQQMIQGMKSKQAETGLKQAQTQKEIALAEKALREEDPALKLVQTGKISPAQYAQYKRGEISMDDLSLVEKAGGGSSQERMIEQMINTQMPNATEEQKAAVRAKLYGSILTQARWGVDPVSNQLYKTEGVSLPSELGTSTQPKPTTNTLPSPSEGRKPIDMSDRDKFTSGKEQLDLLKPASLSFKDKYAGFKSDALATAALEAGRRGIAPSMTESAQWWENYQQWLTNLMKTTFGASLTENEKSQILKFTASPAQEPKVVKENINRQIGIIEKTLANRATELANTGYNLGGVEQMLGVRPQLDVSGMSQKQAVDSILNSGFSKAEQLRMLKAIKDKGEMQ